ncbi:MAG: helix-turn-helix domain-containing protein [Thermomicrobiales bacterium]
MTPDELLRQYPRETLRWLRRRLGLSQQDFAERIDVMPHTVGAWEARIRPIGSASEQRLAALLAPHLASPGGATFVQSLALGEAAASQCAPEGSVTRPGEAEPRRRARGRTSWQ